VPSPSNPPSGCHFHTRCWLRARMGNPERCVAEIPTLRELGTGHEVACHFAEEVEGSPEQRLDLAPAGSGAPAASGPPVPPASPQQQ
jgi:peptide/nickel transport system ATP-binding protein